MKVHWKKPLPDHTKLDYDECCAFLILKELFPEKYADLQLPDKPDIQGEDVGIEVTIAIDRIRQEALNNCIKANYCDDDVKKAFYIERMRKLGVEYTEGVQVWPSFEPTFDIIKKAIDIKIKKKKCGNYKYFSRYELFIFTDTWFYDDLIEEAKNYIMSENVINNFMRVYVLSQGHDLHIFERDYYQNIKIDIFEQSERNIRARIMVEEAEEK